MRADIHNGPGHKRLQSKVGYIDARPHIRPLDESACNARPDHTMGHFRLSCPPAASPFMSAAPPIAAVLSMDGCWSVSAKRRPEQMQQTESLFEHLVRKSEQIIGYVQP